VNWAQRDKTQSREL